jgi:hypothetical protein
MKIQKIMIPALITLLSLTLFNSCQSIKNISDALLNLQRLQFKLDNVTNFNLAGVRLDDKTSISNFSVTDGLKLTRAFSSRSLPADFILNLDALNPNDGKGGSKQSNATITRLDWQLYIDDVPTVSGVNNENLVIPGTGQTSIIPLKLSLDLYRFFENKSYEGIVNLALAIGGLRGSPARLKLDLKPTVTTPFGPMTYPGRITVIDREFRS